jgi:small subunit ribosomal protein S17
MSRPRGQRRRIRGVVVAEKGAKTVTIEVVSHTRHPKYGKMVRHDRRFRVHDEKDEAHVGDTIEVVECRPMSATKHLRLERVIERAPQEVVAVPPPSPEAGTPAQ